MPCIKKPKGRRYRKITIGRRSSIKVAFAKWKFRRPLDSRFQAAKPTGDEITKKSLYDYYDQECRNNRSEHLD